MYVTVIPAAGLMLPGTHPQVTRLLLKTAFVQGQLRAFVMPALGVDVVIGICPGK
jgi:hypothetical protein